MSKKTVRCFLIVITILAIGIVGCSGSRETTITIPEDFIENIPNSSPQEVMDNWETDESGKPEYISYDIKNDSLEVTLSSEQQKKVLLSQESLLKELQQEFSSKKDSNNKIEYTSDYSITSYCIDQNTDNNELYASIELVVARCGWYRVLSGYQENWLTKIRVFNAGSGKLIAESDEEGNLSWTEEDWERSEK